MIEGPPAGIGLRKVNNWAVQPTWEEMGLELQREAFYMPGATTVGLVCDRGVILAAEKRVSYGYYIMSRAGKKVFKITDRIGVACAGMVSDMQILVRNVGAYARLYEYEVGRPMSVRAAAKLMSNMLFEQRSFPLLTQTIVGGIDDEGPVLYVLDPLGSVVPDKYAAVGSGAEIAMGVLEAEYKEGLSMELGRELALRAIKSAISRDAISGDGVDMLFITPDGAKEESIRF